MEISDELRERILSQYELYYKSLLKEAKVQIKSTSEYVTVPILLDGVMDFVRFNVAEQRFDQLEVFVAAEGVTPVSWLDEEPIRGALCTKSRKVIIPLEEEAKK